MEIRKKTDSPRVRPDLKEHREQLIAEGQERIRSAGEDTRVFAERTKQVAESKAAPQRDTIEISTRGEEPAVRETSQSRREYVSSLRERYAAGENIVTEDMANRAADGLLRSPSDLL